MNKVFYSVFCIVFLGILTACGGGDETEKETNAGEPETKYKQSCAQCHGADLISGSAPDLNKIGSKYSQEEIKEIIENGQGSMPGKLLKGEDAEAVATWLAEKK